MHGSEQLPIAVAFVAAARVIVNHTGEGGSLYCKETTGAYSHIKHAPVLSPITR
jgi:hypothetical protein